jgi:hypothetical protein
MTFQTLAIEDRELITNLPPIERYMRKVKLLRMISQYLKYS